MPLIEIWNAAPKTVLGMLLPAVVNIATNGDSLKDGSQGAAEFRQYLTEVEAEKLAEYATYCIENSFPDSGQVLQPRMLLRALMREVKFMEWFNQCAPTIRRVA